MLNGYFLEPFHMSLIGYKSSFLLERKKLPLLVNDPCVVCTTKIRLTITYGACILKLAKGGSFIKRATLYRFLGCFIEPQLQEQATDINVKKLAVFC